MFMADMRALVVALIDTWVPPVAAVQAVFELLSLVAARAQIWVMEKPNLVMLENFNGGEAWFLDLSCYEEAWLCKEMLNFPFRLLRLSIILRVLCVRSSWVFCLTGEGHPDNATMVRCIIPQ